MTLEFGAVQPGKLAPDEVDGTRPFEQLDVLVGVSVCAVGRDSWSTTGADGDTAWVDPKGEGRGQTVGCPEALFRLVHAQASCLTSGYEGFIDPLPAQVSMPVHGTRRRPPFGLLSVPALPITLDQRTTEGLGESLEGVERPCRLGCGRPVFTEEGAEVCDGGVDLG